MPRQTETLLSNVNIFNEVFQVTLLKQDVIDMFALYSALYYLKVKLPRLIRVSLDCGATLSFFFFSLR